MLYDSELKFRRADTMDLNRRGRDCPQNDPFGHPLLSLDYLGHGMLNLEHLGFIRYGQT